MGEFELNEKAKAEFLNLPVIKSNFVNCWFDGQKLVMPSGQGKTLKGVVLASLEVFKEQQSKIEHLTEMNKRYLGKMLEQQDQIAEFKSKNNALHALCRMRGAVISAEKWSVLRPYIKQAIKCLDRKEKALRGES